MTVLYDKPCTDFCTLVIFGDDPLSAAVGQIYWATNDINDDNNQVKRALNHPKRSMLSEQQERRKKRNDKKWRTWLVSMFCRCRRDAAVSVRGFFLEQLRMNGVVDDSLLRPHIGSTIRDDGLSSRDWFRFVFLITFDDVLISRSPSKPDRNPLQYNIYF